MFFKAKPTISADDLEWQILTWEWLITNLGGLGALKNYPTLIPSKIDFSPSGKEGADHASFVFDQVAKRLNVDPSGFELIAQERSVDPKIGDLMVVQKAPVNPLGTFSNSKELKKMQISYSPELLTDLEALIATFAHEICHPILLSISTPPPGDVNTEEVGFDLIEELATDLAMTYYGFGIFGANGAFSFSQFTDNSSGTQGWQISGAGYLSTNMWGFALAVRTMLTGESEENIRNHAEKNILSNYDKNLKFLRKNPSVLEPLLAIE